jgi:hypothetical protein
MSADSSFMFYLMGQWTNEYFSLPDGNNRDSNHDTFMVYSFNGDADKWDDPLPDLHLAHAYLHWNFNSAVEGIVCEMVTGENQNDIKEYRLDSKKVSGIISSKKGV